MYKKCTKSYSAGIGRLRAGVQGHAMDFFFLVPYFTIMKLCRPVARKSGMGID